MARFHHILFPTDLSSLCATFAAEVSYVARQMHAEVTLLHVIDGCPYWYGSVLLEAGCAPEFSNVFTQERELCDSIFRDFEKSSGLSVHTVVEGGDPVETICDYPRTHPVDLVMVPTHGAGLARRFLHRAVVARLLSSSPCAVWTTAHDEVISSHIPCRRIIAAVGFQSEAEYVVRTAVETGTAFGAEVRLLHAVEGAQVETDTRGQIADPHLDEFLLNTARQRLSTLQNSVHTDLPAIVRPGKVADVIADTAAQWGADLVLTGRSSLHRFLGSLRSHAYDIVNRSPCCVLAV